MINDEMVVEYLTQAGFWKNENLYFLGQFAKPFWKKIIGLFFFGAIAGLSEGSLVIVNKNGDGIAVLPVKMANFEAKLMPVLKSSYFIANADIIEIKITKNSAQNRIDFVTNTKGKFSIAVEGSNPHIARHEQNFSKFLALYPVKEM